MSTAGGVESDAWVCEVLSPSTKRLDRFKKWPVYAREQVQYAWFVEPIAKTVEICVLNGADLKLQRTHRREERVRAVPFDAIEIELADLWTDTQTRASAEREGT